MTTPADAATADEAAFEACLAGRSVPEGAQDLAAFTDAVRAGASAPGRPNAALAELLATGLLAHPQEPSRGTAGHRARTSRKRPRMLFSTLLVKIASAGALAKAAAGTGVVVVALTGAAATGVVTAHEEPSVVDPVRTPTSQPTSSPSVSPTPEAGAAQQSVEQPPTSQEAPVAAELEAEVWAADGPAGYPTSGAWVSAGASSSTLKAELRAEGRSFGDVVSDWAHCKDLDAEDLQVACVDRDGVPVVTTAPGAQVDTQVTTPTVDAGTTTDDRGSRGNGSAGGRNGNAGGAGNGNGNVGGNSGGNGNGRK